MLRTKKFLSVLLTIVMLLQTLVIPNFAADVSGFVDFPSNSWSSAAMTAAVDNGLLVGTSDTTIEPSKNLTRAEFAAIVSRAFGATKTADISNFADVDADDWYYTAVAKAVQMGVMNGTSETTFSPAAFMKREDVILSLARVLFVDGEDTSVLDRFLDKNSIDYWSYKAIAGMVSEGYVNGYEDGTIRPLNFITREELAQLFHNIFKTYVSVQGTYDYIPGNGSVVIRTPEVTLRNMTINGDLVMADGIGEGDLTLINVTVLGKIIARGGEGTVYFKGVESDGLVIINDPNGVVNFHNYRDEKPFVNNLLENTPATFLERGGSVGGGSTGGSNGGGGGGFVPSSKYSLYFYESLEDLNDEVNPVSKTTGKKAAYVVMPSDVPTDSEMEKSGFEFQGWSKKNSVEVKNRSYFIGKNISKVAGKWYAVYNQIEPSDDYTITFATPDGEVSVTKTEGEKLEESDIPEIEVEESKEFIGWTTEEGSTTVVYTNEDLIENNVDELFDELEVTLYPVIVDKEAYNVIFVGEGTVTKYDPDEELEDADVPEDPEKENHIFKGWSQSQNAEDGEERDYFFGKPVSELAGTWYPIFEKIPDDYTITFAIDGEDVVLTKTEGETIDASEIPEIEVDESEEFKGWTTEAGSTNVEYTNEQLTADVVENVFKDALKVTLYPVVEEKDAYNVIFVDANTVTKYDSEYVLKETDVPEDPEKENYTFKGWAKAADETDETKIFDRDYFVGKTVSEVAGTWNPIFEEIYVPAEYTITFAIDGEDVVLTKTEGETIGASEIPEIEVDESEEFKGWTTEAGSTNVEYTNEQLTADVVENVFKDALKVTLYPVVEEKDAYNVIFVDANTVTKYDPDYVLKETDVPEDPEKENYTFKGWAKAADETDETKIFDRDYFVGKTVFEVAGTWNPIFELIVLPDEYIIKFVIDGEDVVLTKTEGETIDATEIPAVTVDESKEFLGWTTENVSTNVDYKNEDLTADVVENIFKDALEVTLYPVIGDKTAYVVTFKLDDGDVVITKYDPDEIVDGSLVPEDPEKDNHTFKGWAEKADETDETKIYGRDYFADKAVSEIDGTWYPIFEIIVEPDEYSITFAIPGLDKNIKKLEGETIDASEIPEITVDESKEFMGWSLKEGSDTADFNADTLTADVVENLFDTTEVVLYPVIVENELFEVIFVMPDEDIEVSSYDSDYMLSDSEVPANPEKENYTFEGWSQDKYAEEGKDRSYFLDNPISVISGKWYPVFKEILDEYTITFVTDDGETVVTKLEGEAIEADEIPEVTVPEDYTFEGWSTVENSEEPEYTEDELTADVVENVFGGLKVTLYPVFKAVEPVVYKVEFKFTNGEEAIEAVEQALAPSKDYTLTSNDVYDVDHFEKPEDYKFLGWTTEIDGTDYIPSEEIVGLSIKDIDGTIYYAQFEKVTNNYFVFFKYAADSSKEALETVEQTLAASEDYALKDTDVYDVDYFEEPYAKYVFLGWTTEIDGTDYIPSEEIVGLSIKGIDGTTYYAQFETLHTVTFYDLGISEDPVVDPVYVKTETVVGEENVYPAKEEYELWYELGYEKSYDTDYFDPDGMGYTDEENLHGYDYAHLLNFEWYYEDENGELVRYTDETVIERDLDVYAKVRKVDIEIEIPKSLIDVDEVLIFNLPYEDDTRFLDIVRDALFFNADQVTLKINETGIEEKLYDKLTGIGEGYFEDGGVLNSEYEINKTDVLVRFFYLKQTKAEFADWLWEECEDSVIAGLNPAGVEEYRNEVRPGKSAAQALKIYFEDMRDVYNPPVSSVEKYEASKLFIYEVNEEDEFTVTADNGFITEKVAGEIAKVGTFYDALDYLAGDRIPEGLLNRLPVEEIVVPIYDNSIGAFNSQFEQAKADAAASGEPQKVTSGFRFNINLVTEIMIPLMDWSKDTHNNALDRVVASGNRIAQYAEKYYIDNPYAAGFDGGCEGFVNGYVDADLYVEDLDNDELYTIKPLSEIYFNVLMPLSVESTDALIWFTKNSDFSKLEEILMDPDNKRVALHFVNHTNALMARYAEEGLPEDIIEYYNDLLEDEVVADAIEKLNSKAPFDMMYFVETKLNNQMAEMLYMKLLNRLGVPAEMLLSQYVNTPAYKEYTEEDYDNYVEQLGEIWADTYTTDDGLDNIFSLGDGDDSVTISLKGFSATLKRSVANTIFD